MIHALIFYFVPVEEVGLIQNFQALIQFSSFTRITYFSLKDSKRCLFCYSVLWNRISHFCLKRGDIKSSQHYWAEAKYQISGNSTSIIKI
jgi:hypothetical protein